MSAGGGQRHPLDRVAEEFAERLRRGETPEVEAYAAAHPELADRIRELFPTLLVMEALAPLRETEAEAPQVAGPLVLPSVIGPWRLGREIGRGGMGVVFEATAADARADAAPVALKVVQRHLSQRLGFLERFLREASVGSRVRHPNVVHTLGAGVHETEDGRELPYLVMERVEGATLREMAEQLGGRIPEPLLRHLAGQIAAGLESIHAEGIVHRDLKPSNVMVTEDHLVRIMDLGVARLQDASDRVSSTGQFVGSVRYAAPEQFHAGRRTVGPAADLYALGVTLYELATGGHPFDTASPYTLMAGHLNEPPTPARDHAPHLSPFLSALLDRLLAKDPDARLASAGELARVLAEGEAGSWWSHARGQLPATSTEVRRPALRHEGTHRGRDLALGRLLAAWGEARDGRGRVVVLRGEAGLGKTRLVAAFAEALEGETARMLYGSYPPGGGRGGLAAAVLDALGPAGLERRLAVHLGGTRDLVAPFAAWLEDLPPQGRAEPLDVRTVRTLYVHLLEGLARERPTAWVVDDLQFASGEDQRIVLDLARATRDRPALLVLTTREGLPPPLAEELGRLPHVETLALEPLPRAESLALLADVLGSAPWVQLVAERVVEAADGNPFFLLEMAREIARERRDGHLGNTETPSSDALRRLLVPDAIRELVLVRLRGVSEKDRPLLEVGALLGFEFDPEVVAAALDVDLLDALQAFGALERRTGVLRSTENHLRFRHHQILEVIREDLPPRLARAYHARIARVLEARRGETAGASPEEGVLATARIAEHALRGGETELGLRSVGPALAFLASRHAVRDVLELCDLALAADPAPGPDLRARVLHRRLHACGMLGLRQEYVQSAHDLHAAAKEAGDPELLARAYRELGQLATNQGDAEAARTWLDKALASARELGDPALEISAHLSLATQAASQGDFRAAIGHGERARRLARARGMHENEAQSLLATAGYSGFSGAYAEALERIEEGLALLPPDMQYSRRPLMRAFGQRGNVYYALGRYPEALESYEASLDLAQRIGDREFTAVNLDNRGGTLLALGRLGEALATLEQSVELAEAVAGRTKATASRANLGSARLLVGDLEAAARDLDEALASTRAHGMRRLEAYLLHDLAILRECRGDVEGALAHAHAALDLRTAQGKEGLAASHLQLGALLVRHDANGDAEESLHAAIRTAAETGEAILVARARLWLAVLGRHPASEVVVPPRPAVLDAIEMHALRHRAGLRDPDPLDEAHRVFAAAAETLPTLDARASFRDRSPTAGLLRLLSL